MLNINFLKFLNYGAIGVGTGLVILSYNLLIKALEKSEVPVNLIKLLWIFIIYSALIVILAFIKELYDRKMRMRSINEIDPSDPKTWGKSRNFDFKWYNAPYGLAVRELGKMNINKIKNQNVKYKFLLFEGNDEVGRKIFERRYELLKKFLIHMKENKATLSGNIEVRVNSEIPLPSITFYILKKNNKDTAIFYLGPCVEKDGKAIKAFQTQNEAVFHRLNHEFHEHWETAKEIDLDKLVV